MNMNPHQLQQQNFSEQQLAAIQSLYSQCASYLSENECLSFLTSSQWNYSHCEYLLITIPKEIENKTSIPPILSLRILGDSQVDWRNLELCQVRINMMVDLSQKTRLNYYLCHDCLTQSDWNLDLALELFNRHKSNIPESGFINHIHPNNNNNLNNLVNSSGESNAFQENAPPMIQIDHQQMPPSESPSLGNVYFSIGNQLPSSFTDQSQLMDGSSASVAVQPHANTPENSPNESATILNTSRISIISNYF